MDNFNPGEEMQNPPYSHWKSIDCCLNPGMVFFTSQRHQELIIRFNTNKGIVSLHNSPLKPHLYEYIIKLQDVQHRFLHEKPMYLLNIGDNSLFKKLGSELKKYEIVPYSEGKFKLSIKKFVEALYFFLDGINQIIKREFNIWLSIKKETLIQEYIKDEKDTKPSGDGRLIKPDEIEVVVSLLRPYYLPDYQIDIVYSLAHLMKTERIRPEAAMEIIDKLTENDEDKAQKLRIIHRIYSEDINLNENEIRDIWRSMENQGIEPEQIRVIKKELYRIIKAPKHDGMITGPMGSDTLTIVDPFKKQILYETVNIRNNKDYSKTIIVADAYPKELTVYESPLVEETRKFEIVFESNIAHRPFKIGPTLLEDIIRYLKESGYVLSSKYINDVMPAVVNAYIRKGIAKIKKEIESPGFFIDSKTGQLLAVKYDVKEITADDIKQGLEVLEEFADWFSNQKVKLATILKWGLISPFIFPKKQLGHWVEWPFLYGKAGSGKTTMGKMVLYLWGEPNSTNDIGGSSFNTEARIGDRLKQFTFPIVVNEPMGTFEKIGTVEMLKSAIERTNSRGRYEGRTYRNIPSFSPAVFTSNQAIPDDDAMARRLLIIVFSYSERKTREEKDAFEKKFQMDNPKNCKLHALKALSQFAAGEIIADPQLLELDWRELADRLIIRMYSDVDIEIPEWLKKWVKPETMEDLDDVHRENIRIFLQKEVNNAYGRVEIFDEDGRPAKRMYDNSIEVKTTDDFESRVWIVLNERKIPWMLLNRNDKIILTSGFIEALKKDTCINETLQSIAELLGWDHKKTSVRSAGFNGWSIQVNRSKFTRFVFPNFELEETCDDTSVVIS